MDEMIGEDMQLLLLVHAVELHFKSGFGSHFTDFFKTL